MFAATGLALVVGCGGAASETTPDPAAQGNTAVAVQAPQSTVAVPAPASTNDAAAPTPPTPPPAPTPSSAPAAAGVHESWADYEKNPAAAAKGKVVLFFHAGWCPTCQEAERNLTSEPVPAGLTIVKVDYDNSSDLRQKYGVTVQHTFVQVDVSGTQLAKWSSSNDAAAILGKTV